MKSVKISRQPIFENVATVSFVHVVVTSSLQHDLGIALLLTVQSVWLLMPQHLRILASLYLRAVSDSRVWSRGHAHVLCANETWG